ILRSIRKGILDRTPQPPAPLDILAQQVVASCVPETWEENRLFEQFRRAWPYRDLPREDFEKVLDLHAQGRRSLLHRDGVGGRVMGTKRARLTAIMSGGAIPDTADYQVVMEPDGSPVGSVNEDFAIESNQGDIFQLGNTSWRILKGEPPTIPFWTGESPARSAELSAEIAQVREECVDADWVTRETGMTEGAAR